MVGSAFFDTYRSLGARAANDVRYAKLIRSTRNAALEPILRAWLSHESITVRQAAALSPVLAHERTIGPILIQALAHGGLLADEGRETFARLAELGTSEAILAALATTVLARPIADRESWGAAVAALARADERGFASFAERWLHEQVALSTSCAHEGLEYDGLAFDPDFRGPYLYAAIAELERIPEGLARLLMHISKGGFRRGYTAIFPLAAHGDAGALEWIGRALEWVPPGVLFALGDAVVPYLVRTLSMRHSGVAYAFAALEALDAAKAERAKFVADVMDELKLAPPGHELTRSIELLGSAVTSLTGDQVWGLLQLRLSELDQRQLQRMLELLARTKDPRLEPFLLDRVRQRDGTAMLFLAQLGAPEAAALVDALRELCGPASGPAMAAELAAGLGSPVALSTAAGSGATGSASVSGSAPRATAGSGAASGSRATAGSGAGSGSSVSAQPGARVGSGPASRVGSGDAREEHAPWYYVARQLRMPSRGVLEHALTTCHPVELLPLLARSGADGVRAIMGELGAGDFCVPLRRVPLWEEVGPDALLTTLRTLAEGLEASEALDAFVDHPDARAAVLAREALLAVGTEPAREPAPFSMEWAHRFRARRAARAPAKVAAFLASGWVSRMSALA